MDCHDKAILLRVSEAAIYIPFNCEGIRISHYDTDRGCFFGQGEESGDEYTVFFEDVDLKNDAFYKLVLMA